MQENVAGLGEMLSYQYDSIHMKLWASVLRMQSSDYSGEGEKKSYSYKRRLIKVKG